MSLPAFSAPQTLFGVGSLADNLFPAANRDWLFAEKVGPLLAQARPAHRLRNHLERGILARFAFLGRHLDMRPLELPPAPQLGRPRPTGGSVRMRYLRRGATGSRLAGRSHKGDSGEIRLVARAAARQD